ncbi:hypothetical protein DA798_08335 [Lactobacillus sp. PFC-70]|nr:hypothetical protein DA798_08335 [Lactobacillus sp. PFC-70]
MRHFERIMLGLVALVAGMLLWTGQATPAAAARHYTTTPTNLRGDWITPLNGGQQVQRIIVTKYTVMGVVQNQQGKVVKAWRVNGKLFLSKKSKKTQLYVSKKTAAGYRTIGARKVKSQRFKLKVGKTFLNFPTLRRPATTKTDVQTYFKTADLPAIQKAVADAKTQLAAQEAAQQAIQA